MHSVKQAESIRKRYHRRKNFLSILNAARNQEQIEIFSDKSLITGSVLKVRIFVSAFFSGGVLSTGNEYIMTFYFVISI